LSGCLVSAITLLCTRTDSRNYQHYFYRWILCADCNQINVEFMEIKQEHRDWLIANENNYECAKNGYIRNLDLPVLQMYEHIYRLYLDPNFLLSVWCGNCKYDMIMRLYKWFEAQ
jgi:hypothetical protein